MRTSRVFLLLAVLAGACRTTGTPSSTAVPPAAPLALPTFAPAGPPPASVADLLRVRGADVVDAKGQPVMLRGVAFGNEVWVNTRIPSRHHAAIDYERVAAMGMNAVRFYFNYHTLESDRAPGQYLADGWQWLDENVAWAKRHGVYIIINMHVPPGGFQSLGAGKALWTKPEMQDRFVALWTAIAQHFRGEPTIAGYDLLNEPLPVKSKAQWRELAGRVAKSIRTVDPEHILFVERVNAVNGDWAEDPERNFFTIDDPNVVYEFHFYKPFQFTHQSASWVPFTAEDVRYPDPERAEVEWFLLDQKASTEDSPRLPPGDTPWTFYQGAPFKVTDPSLVVGKPALVTRANSGTVYFDDIVLEELDDSGKVKREIWRRNLKNQRGWFFWTKDGSGGAVPGREGHDDDASLVAAGTRGDANLGSDVLRFRVEQGATYRLSGWMKGEKIPPGATCQIRLDFFSSRAPLQAGDRLFLEQEMNAYVEWGRRHNVPLFLGEFGAIRFSFDENRGGLRWVSDMLDLAAQHRLHFTYHAYHEDGFGLFRGIELPEPERANQPLIDLFRQRLQNTAVDASRR